MTDHLDDDPQVIGSWLVFKDPEHTGHVFLPLAEIKTMQTLAGVHLDVHCKIPTDAELAESVAHDCSLSWWRIACPNPDVVAGLIVDGIGR